MWAKRPVSVWAATSETITSGQAASAPAHRVAVRERHHRVGTHDPDRFDLAAANGGKQLHGGQPGGLRQPFRPPRSGPAAADRLAQNPCVPPASSPARRLRGRPWRWVDRSAKRGRIRGGHTPAGQMDVDDGVTFVAAAGGLIDSHGVEGDRPRGGDELAIESRHLIGRQTAKAATLATSQPRAAASACGPSRKPSTQAPASAGALSSPANNPPSLPRGQRQMAVGDLAGSGASGVDRHDPQSGIIPLRLRQPLEQHRMRPGRRSSRPAPPDRCFPHHRSCRAPRRRQRPACSQ